MIIEIKDLPKNAKRVTISEIVIEFEDSNEKQVKPLETISMPKEVKESKEPLKIPEIEERELAEIPEEMLNMEF